MAFMKPDIQHDLWVEITHDCGSTTWVPADVCPDIMPNGQPKVGEAVPVTYEECLEWVADLFPLKRRPLNNRLRVWRRRNERAARAIVEHGAGFKDFIESGEVEALKLVEGWGGRLSAPGYMDCTEWTVYDSEEEARHELADMYDLCGECLEELDDKGACPECDKPTYEKEMNDSLRTE